MTDIKVSTQAELDAALAKAAKAKGTPPRIILVGGSPNDRLVVGESAHVEAWGSAHVVAWESAHVVAWGSAHVEAWGSAHVVARGSAHVEAWGSAHVEARESAHVVAWESAHVEACPYVSVHKMLGHNGQITGGVVIAQPELRSIEDWCAYHGVPITNGVVVLYKGVRDDYRSGHGFLYTPGTTPEAPDWDGGQEECGGGLHFCAFPAATLGFDSEATRFLACPVAIADLRGPKAGDQNTSKVKARRICAPIYEVDRWGKPVAAPAVEATA